MKTEMIKCRYCHRHNWRELERCAWCNRAIPTRTSRITDVIMVVVALVALAALVWGMAP
jgi:hypothetical protein